LIEGAIALPDRHRAEDGGHLVTDAQKASIGERPPRAERQVAWASSSRCRVR